MIKPKYVHNGKTYTREEAVKAMNISQASFSKYFAFKNIEELVEHTTPNRVVYKGIELNKRIIDPKNIQIKTITTTNFQIKDNLTDLKKKI